jgi:hypothetical protein
MFEGRIGNSGSGAQAGDFVGVFDKAQFVHGRADGLEAELRLAQWLAHPLQPRERHAALHAKHPHAKCLCSLGDRLTELLQHGVHDNRHIGDLALRLRGVDAPRQEPLCVGGQQQRAERAREAR